MGRPGHLLANPIPADEGERTEEGEITTESTGNATREPDIAHGCPTIPRVQAGVRDCSYYCKYVRKNHTWLYGHYSDGIYCWQQVYPGKVFGVKNNFHQRKVQDA
nr:uncharacterized protein LOC129384205 [Dermacentor andersoni]